MFRVTWVETTGSTNTDVLAAAGWGEPEGLVIVADHQTAGRGRLGRTWEAPAGSALLATFLLRPPAGLVHVAVTALGCAAAAACDLPAVGLKWPNDLVAGDRKLAGILAEREGNVTAVAAGIGLNLHRHAHTLDTAVALDDLTADVPTREDLVEKICAELEPRYRALVDVGPASLIAEYRSRCVTIGRSVRVEQPDRVLEGTAVDVDDAGALLLQTRSALVRVEVGDVVHVRPA